MSTMPTCVDGDLFAAAKSSGALHSGSAAKQVAHWARIVRELEASSGVSHRDVGAVLSGDSYYGVGERKQAIVRVGWVEADEDGRLVTKRTAEA